MKTIVLNGKTYQLVPLEDDGKPRQVAPEPPKADLLSEYQVDEKPLPGITRAVPKVSQYREKFRTRTLSLADLPRVHKVYHQLPKQDAELDNFRYQGEKLFFGPGIEQEA